MYISDVNTLMAGVTCTLDFGWLTKIFNINGQMKISVLEQNQNVFYV